MERPAIRLVDAVASQCHSHEALKGSRVNERVWRDATAESRERAATFVSLRLMMYNSAAHRALDTDF
ncbi:hypothetical protein HMPREF0578_2046 [Mobiluncus mulieris 28-1]|nr:hypothetical protein HMPREF0578_2046 [Mobiluncus mulieris 28-1]